MGFHVRKDFAQPIFGIEDWDWIDVEEHKVEIGQVQVIRVTSRVWVRGANEPKGSLGVTRKIQERDVGPREADAIDMLFSVWIAVLGYFSKRHSPGN